MNKSSSNSKLSHVMTLHKDLSQQKIMLAFEGGFTQNLTKNILSLAENRLNQEKEHISVKKKVFNVMVECLQNISKHAGGVSKPEDWLNEGVFIIGRDDYGYFLISGNFIGNENIEELEAKITEVNKLDKNGLRELYMNKLVEGELKANSTAGLGLIDIARKSGNKLIYKFEKIDDSRSFYSLSTYVVHTSNESQ
ncbi:MAG: hypothetical protein EAZ27_11600 [Cytophagales bacterium]|nr:MAG: hypothetical protein EAZ27_11600 [Cytophagales bacterium]